MEDVGYKISHDILIVFYMWIFTRDGMRAASVRAYLSFALVCGKLRADK